MIDTNNPQGIYLASKGLLGPFQTLTTSDYLTTIKVGESLSSDSMDCVWGEIEFLWAEIDYLWNSIIPCIGRIITAGGGHPEEVYNIYQNKKINKKTKKKIIKLIMILKDNRFVEEHEINVNEYDVTVDDIKLLINEYKEYQKRQIAITVESVGIRM